MKVKDLVSQCTDKELIVIRQNKREVRIPNVNPYKKFIANYLNYAVKDYFYDNNAVIIIL